jgi:DNA-directed RNA polymerase specialized sigma24 family protein
MIALKSEAAVVRKIETRQIDASARGRQGGEPTMTSDGPGADGGSVTRWIGHLKEKDGAAALHLWERYFHRLVGLARIKLGQAPKAVGDEEDAALSAFHSLCDGAGRGRFDRLRNREDLWRLLVVITSNKATDLKKWQGRAKRGAGRVTSELDPSGEASGGPSALERIASAEPTPGLAAELAEEYQRRLDALGDDTLRRIAQLRLEGYDYDEIAERLGVARRTVARKLQMIRVAWGGVNEGNEA